MLRMVSVSREPPVVDIDVGVSGADAGSADVEGTIMCTVVSTMILPLLYFISYVYINAMGHRHPGEAV